MMPGDTERQELTGKLTGGSIASRLSGLVVVRWLMAQAPSPSTTAIAMAPPIQGVLFVS